MYLGVILNTREYLEFSLSIHKNPKLIPNSNNEKGELGDNYYF